MVFLLRLLLCKLANQFKKWTARQLILQYQAVAWDYTDAQTGMPTGIPVGAMCVQRFDDSLESAIHTTYRISLRSSSMQEPRDPLLKVLISIFMVDSE